MNKFALGNNIETFWFWPASHEGIAQERRGEGEAGST
jgi:hypothetical protein